MFSSFNHHNRNFQNKTSTEAKSQTAISSTTPDHNRVGIPPILIFSVCLAASAGFTMYTKRATSMLRTMEKVTERQQLRNPPRIGPPTKEEWEKIRPRWEKDDI